jgi:hypothetical protein
VVHYLAHGRVEVIGKADRRPCGRLRHPGAARSPQCDQRAGDEDVRPAASRPQSTLAAARLRWAVVSGDSDDLRFDLCTGQLRTVLARCGPERAAAVAEFCADLALHDWLLTMLLRLLEGSGIGSEARDAVVARLRPAVDHLLPVDASARTDGSAGFWPASGATGLGGNGGRASSGSAPRSR